MPPGAPRPDAQASIERALIDISPRNVVRVYNPIPDAELLFAAASLADHDLLERSGHREARSKY